MKIEIYYDKDCPFCNKYAQILELKKEHDLTIKNARENLDKLRYFYSYGYDINNGIIIEVDGKIYQGAKAIYVLDSLSIRNNYLYGTKLFKNFLYPVLKIIRKVYLLLSGRKSKIEYEEL